MAPEKTIGFIGGGEMAWAMVCGFISGEGGLNPSNLFVSNPSSGKLKRYADKGIPTTNDNIAVIKKCDVIFLCVKPQIFPTVADQVKKNEGGNACCKLIVSIMAGVTIETMQDVFPKSYIIRTLPNTAALVQSGITIVSACPKVPAKEVEYTEAILKKCGEVVRLPERLINAGMAISGCGIGYMLCAIDAFADGGVKMGLPRATALKLAATMLVGTGKMYLETGVQPVALKDTVTSPGGTTIVGLHEMEKGGFRNAIINAVEAATLKGNELCEASAKK